MSCLEIFICITIIAYAAFLAFAVYHLIKDRIKPPDLPVIGTTDVIVSWAASIAGLIAAFKFQERQEILALVFLAIVFVVQFRMLLMDYLLYFKSESPISLPYAFPATLSFLLISICCAADLALLFTALVPVCIAVLFAVLAVFIFFFICAAGFYLFVCISSMR